MSSWGLLRVSILARSQWPMNDPGPSLKVNLLRHPYILLSKYSIFHNHHFPTEEDCKHNLFAPAFKTLHLCKISGSRKAKTNNLVCIWVGEGLTEAQYCVLAAPGNLVLQRPIKFEVRPGEEVLGPISTMHHQIYIQDTTGSSNSVRT